MIITSSQTSRFATECVTTTTVLPSSARFLNIFITERSSPGSRPEVGSSRKSNAGSVNSSKATLVLFLCPPESLSILKSARSVSSRSLSTSSTLFSLSRGEVSTGKRSAAPYSKAFLVVKFV